MTSSRKEIDATNDNPLVNHVIRRAGTLYLSERQKIDCGWAHFGELQVDFDVLKDAPRRCGFA